MFPFYVKQYMFKYRPQGNKKKNRNSFDYVPKFLHFHYLRKNPAILLRGQDMSQIEFGPLDCKAVL